MKNALVLSAVALIGVSAVAVDTAEARSRRGAAVAAGVVGGLAAGALIGAATSGAYAAPAYSYGYPAYDYAPVNYGYGVSAYDYGYEAPVTTVRTRRVVQTYEPAPVYRSRRVVQSYDYDGYGEPVTTGSVRVVRNYDYGYAPVSTGYRWGSPVHQGYTYGYGW